MVFQLVNKGESGDASKIMGIEAGGSVSNNWGEFLPGSCD